MRPFGCHVTILNTIDHLGKFNGKADEGSGPDWLFDIDALTRTMNYESIVADPKSSHDDGSKPSSDDGKEVDEDPRKDSECNNQEKENNVNITNNVNAASTNEVNVVDDDDVGAEAGINNLDTTIQVSPIPTTRIHKDHLLDQMSSIREHTFFLELQVKQKKDGIFISQDKYVAKILKKFRFIEDKTASTPMETQKPLLKDEDGEEVDIHMYRSMIGSLMYLTSLRPDIMFAMCACARYQINPKVSHLHAMKKIFSDYAGESLDRKSTTGGYQFLGCRLISCQCKKQTVVANSITEVECVAASSCGGQMLWIQNQLLDYWYALTTNPTIYIFCIERFWSTVIAKTINGEEQLHALVDGKKIIITESSVRRDLQLADEEGVDCLPNSTIFEQRSIEAPKTTTWNEFSSTMTSAIICLATNQKFNFSKFIFNSMIRNLDNLSGKFLMYPRFVQIFLDQQLDGMPTHKRIYIAPSHTKKIFGNMRRVGKGFSGRVTPLFQTMVVQNQSQLGEGSAIPTDPHHTPTFIQPSTQPQKTQQPRKPKRKDTQVPQPSDPIKNVADEAVHKELGDSLVRAATTASSLEVEQDSGNINKTQSKATPNESSSQGTNSGGGPWCQETMGDTIAQTRFESVSKHSNDSLLARESSNNKNPLSDDAYKQGRIDAIDADEEITLVSVHDVNVSAGEEVFVAEQDVDEGLRLMMGMLFGKKLELMLDRGKGIWIEPVKLMKKKDQINFDEETALKLQAEFDEKERLAREKAEKEQEANIALIETWDDIQANIDADHQLAERLQAQEQEELYTKKRLHYFNNS
ncbi:hypothetical protein Tco_0575122 [Tanacetum coccineum]